jgi:putative acyl-CoA dehydrogenase
MQRARLLRQQAVISAPIVTHEVKNQVPFLENYNLFTSNRALVDAVKAFNKGRDDTSTLSRYGKLCGESSNIEAAKEANDREPIFTPFDRQGRRIDSVKFVESYHHIMNLAISESVPAFSWSKHKGSQVARCALSYMHYQLECGTGCPLTMTYAAVPPLKANSANGEFTTWVQKLSSGIYDRRDIAASLKGGVTCGMSMTEKQGGSDVRSNETTATKIETPSESWDVAPKAPAYSLVGHKWFTSAPMCDAFLTLAKTEEGLSCFLVPRWLSPEERNVGLKFQRLKSKLGDKSNASSEVEYQGAVGFLVGKLGRGVPTIIEMVNHTRLDCLLGSAALMQVALSHAVHHTAHRDAFGGKLIDKPLMMNVLTDLALEVEGATALAVRVAAAFDDPSQEQFKRIATAIGKYYVCKRAPAFVYECLECLGGNGYVEEFPLARWYRQAPLNAVWEGSGNVIVADVFRAMQGSPATLQALHDEVKRVDNPTISSSFKSTVAQLQAAAKDNTAEITGRRLVEKLALILQACALAQTEAPEAVRNGFLESRLGTGDGVGLRLAQFGTLPAHLVNRDVFMRHKPTLEAKSSL